MQRRIPKKVAALLIVCFVVLLPFLFLCVERVRGKISLACYKKHLATRGEALTAADFVQRIDETQNGAPQVMNAAGQLLQGTVLPNNYPPAMELLPSGHAVPGYRKPDWRDEKNTYTWSELAEDLEHNRGALDQVKAGLQKPVFDHHLDYSQGPKMRFQHLTHAKSLTYWLGSEARLALHQDRVVGSVEPLVAEIRLPHLLENDGILISELVRIAIGAVVSTHTWEALQSDGWADKDLNRVQTAWEGVRFLPNLSRALAGERLFASATFDGCRDSNEDASDILFFASDFLDSEGTDRAAWEKGVRELPWGDEIADFLKKQVYCRIWRFAWLDQCEQHYLEQIQELGEISRRLENTKSLVSAQPELDRLIQGNQNHGWYDEARFPIGVSSLPSVARSVTRALKAETDRSLVITAIALKRFALQSKRSPASLDELVPGFMASVPLDYMDGKPLRYKAASDGTWTLYSVGEDFRDDGGHAELQKNTTAKRDRWKRKDYVWPPLARSDEASDDEPVR